MKPTLHVMEWIPTKEYMIDFNTACDPQTKLGGWLVSREQALRLRVF